MKKYDFVTTFPTIIDSISGIISAYNNSIDYTSKEPEYIYDFILNRIRTRKNRTELRKAKQIYHINVLLEYSDYFYQLLFKFTEKLKKRIGKRKTIKQEVVGDDYYLSTDWHKKKSKAKKRDGFKCTECGSSKFLHVHHVKYKQNSNRDEDLKTLCIFCHALKHPINGRKMIEEWLEKNFK